MVDSMRASVAGRNPTSGISRAAGVELIGVEGLCEGLASLAPPACEHGAADAVALPFPFVGLGVVAEDRRELDGSVQGGPAQHLGGEVMTWLAAHLPHPRVAPLPAAGSVVGQLGGESLNLRMQLAQVLSIARQGIEKLPVDIELGLRPRTVADAHRT
jgi:hypothetical protein